jgi:hypothetical protein
MVSVFGVEDFTGGLNLRADVFNIGKNESPDMLNVDIDPRGGVAQRDGSCRFNSAAIGGITAGLFTPNRMFHWRKASQQVLLAANDKVFYASAENFTDSTIATTAEFGAEFAEWIGEQPYLYVSCGGGSQSARWDGTNKTLLAASGAGAWQDDLLSPTTGFMPKAEHIATHVDRLWVANTVEDGTAYPDRVRFSHPLFPESWRENDYIDVVGGGSGITAIVPFSGHMVVFKPRAVYAIYGYNQSTFQVVPITQELGAFSSQCVASSEQALFFFSWPDGLFAYNGSSIKDLFEPLRPLITTGEVNKNALETVHVNWVKRKVFLSLPVGVSPDDFENYDDTSGDGTVYDQTEMKYDGFVRAPTATVSFVFDPSVGKDGAWTRYRTADGYAMVAGVDYVLPDGVTNGMYVHPYYPYVVRFEPDLATDCIQASPVDFDSYYTFAWQDLGQPQARKFWRSPEFVFSRASGEYDVDVDVFHDWSTFNVDRSFTVNFVAETSGTPDDLESWVQNFGSDTARGETLGSARAVQLRLSSSGAKWGVNALLFRYSFRQVRV